MCIFIVNYYLDMEECTCKWVGVFENTGKLRSLFIQQPLLKNDRKQILLLVLNLLLLN